MRAHRIWVVSAVVAFHLGVLADEVPGPQDAALQRGRIERERLDASATLNAQEQKCYSTFMVNSCLHEVAMRRHEVMANLKRQETDLNEAQRMQQGKEQRQRLEEKMQERRLEEARAAQSPVRPLAEKLDAQRDKQVQHQKQSTPNQRELATAKTASSPDPAVQEQRRAAHAQKLKDANQRRLERDKRVRETKPLQPLPL